MCQNRAVWFLIISTLVLLNCPESLFAETITIGGKVRDKNTHREIPDVNIYVHGTETGTVTNVSGRYSLTIPNASDDLIVVFRHIAFDSIQVRLDGIKDRKNIYLQSRILPFQSVNVEASGDEIEIDKDLRQNVSVLEYRTFELRGFVDAGDLLLTNESIQVDEELSGKKTIAIRGGNEDEVIVLYNGVKMNNSFNNIFDISLVDVEDVQRFEVIKGSNTALYGSDAFSGVINIVPKVQQDYTLRVQQRWGTYQAGNYGLHFYKKLGNLHTAYSFKEGKSKRKYAIENFEDLYLENDSRHHTASLVYNVSDNINFPGNHNFELMYVNSQLDYVNQRDNENLDNSNQMISLKYKGPLVISGAYKELDEKQKLVPDDSSLFNNDIENKSYHLNLEKRVQYQYFNFLLGYQMERTDLDYLDIRSNPAEINLGVESAIFERTNHGAVSIIKFTPPPADNPGFIKTTDFEFSARFDNVRDRQKDVTLRSSSTDDGFASGIGLFEENKWDESTLKFGMNVGGDRNSFYFNSHLNFGKNVKFPTIFQQISQPGLVISGVSTSNLLPEKNESLEISIDVTRELYNHPTIYGWKVNASYFKNTYLNKLRTYYTPGSPVAFYDNVKKADISGFEMKATLYFLQKKLTVEAALSNYEISEKTVFPFKHEYKWFVNGQVDHAGYSFRLHWFKEGDKVGLMRNISGESVEELSEFVFPEYSNLDASFSKSVEIQKMKFFVNFSVRNLLDDGMMEIEGLAFRDRRFYLSLSAQY